MGSSRSSAARHAVDVSFEELYRGHHADVFRDALRELGNVQDAEDVTQAAFVDAYRAVLRGTQPQSPRAWLLAISQNVRRRRFRTAQRRPRELPLDQDFPVAAELPYEQAHALAEALAELPLEQRRVFVLRELAGLSYDEIADEVGSSVNSIQMLLFRARRSLREQLEPPVAAKRRTGLLVPIPSWLTSLASRVELAGLTPRVAGATGATALTVLGASVAVPQAPADIPRPQAASQPPKVAAAAGHAPAARLSSRAAIARPAVRPTPSAVPVGSTAVALPATAAPKQAPTVAPSAAAAVPEVEAAPASTPSAQPVVAPISVDVVERTVAPAPVVGALVEDALPDAPVQLPAPSVPPTVAQVVDAAAGAASAAGANALPLPVPALPPVTLPPTP